MPAETPERPKRRRRDRPRNGEAEHDPQTECGGCWKEGLKTYKGLPWCGRTECGLFIEVMVDLKIGVK